MISRFFLAAIPWLMAACAPLPIVDQSNYSDKAGHEPAFGQQVEAVPGGLMFNQYSHWHRAGARITVSNRQPFGLGGLFISQGDVVYPSLLGQERVYCSEKRLYSDPIAGFVSKACFKDHRHNGTFDTAVVAPEELNWIERPLSPELPYTKMDITVPHRGAFKYEISYSGYSAGTLHLTYREYRGESFDQPAYSDEVKYDIHTFPASILFRTVRMKIAQADNNKIVYQVMNGF